MKAMSIAVLFAVWPAAAGAQMIPSPGGHQAGRGPGWEFALELLYQGSTNVGFEGGTSASLDDAFGFAFGAGYRFNEKLEIQFGIDWQEIDYDVRFQSTEDPDTQFTGRGELDVFTPRVTLNYNFLPGNVTPFVNAGIGWTFIDTNIPQGPPQGVCWWDPWWGPVCGLFQDTKDFDEFRYQLGGGVRWDFAPGYSLRFSYEKHWVDLDRASGSPDFDQFRLGFVFRY